MIIAQAKMTPGDVQQVIRKQVDEWRAEVARLNDLIIAATGGVQVSAGSIGDDPDFVQMLFAWRSAEFARNEFSAIISYIDSRPRQAAQQSSAAALNAALEDAAALMAGKDDGIWANTCAKAIRALKSSAPKLADGEGE